MDATQKLSGARTNEPGLARVLHSDFEDDISDEDLLNFLDFPEEVEEAISEVINASFLPR